MNPKERSERTEAAAIAELVKLGFTVLLPFGDNRLYDIVVEVCGRFLRVQCKTGRLRNGRIEFRAASSVYQPEGATKRYRSYHGDVDAFPSTAGRPTPLTSCRSTTSAHGTASSTSMRR